MNGSEYFREAQLELQDYGAENTDYKVVVVRALNNILVECSTRGTSNDRIIAFMDLTIDFLRELL